MPAPMTIIETANGPNGASAGLPVSARVEAPVPAEMLTVGSAVVAEHRRDDTVTRFEPASSHMASAVAMTFEVVLSSEAGKPPSASCTAVSYTHLRAHET